MPRRRRSPLKTQRQRAIAACAAHLGDLKRFHRRPPADVAVAADPTPRRLAAAPAASGCGSPAASCAELVR